MSYEEKLKQDTELESDESAILDQVREGFSGERTFEQKLGCGRGGSHAEM